ncbi:hypothetical protein [Bradyrhizobium diazoefficiens]
MNTYNVVTMKGDRLKMPPVKNFHVLMEFPWLPDFAKWLLKVVEAEELWFEVRQAELFCAELSSPGNVPGSAAS